MSARRVSVAVVGFVLLIALVVAVATNASGDKESQRSGSTRAPRQTTRTSPPPTTIVTTPVATEPSRETTSAPAAGTTDAPPVAPPRSPVSPQPAAREAPPPEPVHEEAPPPEIALPLTIYVPQYSQDCTNFRVSVRTSRPTTAGALALRVEAPGVVAYDGPVDAAGPDAFYKEIPLAGFGVAYPNKVMASIAITLTDPPGSGGHTFTGNSEVRSWSASGVCNALASA
jgi:hypothetical protein